MHDQEHLGQGTASSNLTRAMQRGLERVTQSKTLIAKDVRKDFSRPDLNRHSLLGCEQAYINNTRLTIGVATRSNGYFRVPPNTYAPDRDHAGTFVVVGSYKFPTTEAMIDFVRDTWIAERMNTKSEDLVFKKFLRYLRGILMRNGYPDPVTHDTGRQDYEFSQSASNPYAQVNLLKAAGGSNLHGQPQRCFRVYYVYREEDLQGDEPVVLTDLDLLVSDMGSPGRTREPVGWGRYADSSVPRPGAQSVEGALFSCTLVDNEGNFTSRQVQTLDGYCTVRAIRDPVRKSGLYVTSVQKDGFGHNVTIDEVHEIGSDKFNQIAKASNDDFLSKDIYDANAKLAKAQEAQRVAERELEDYKSSETRYKNRVSVENEERKFAFDEVTRVAQMQESIRKTARDNSVEDRKTKNIFIEGGLKIVTGILAFGLGIFGLLKKVA